MRRSQLMDCMIHRKMTEIMVNQATSCDLKDFVCKFIAESIGKEIEKATTSIYPLQNVFNRKVKILRAPRFDLGKPMEGIPAQEGDKDCGIFIMRYMKEIVEDKHLEFASKLQRRPDLLYTQNDLDLVRSEPSVVSKNHS